MTFPGGTSVTLLDVYDSVAPDGLIGGSPHLHLASTEAYVVVAGTGALQTVDSHGYRETPLAAGSVVWFSPGTIHRVVNDGGLQVVVIMSNAGLPEAGDAVMTFPPDTLADPERYRAAAVLPAIAPTAEREAAAFARRDLAVEGFTAIREAAKAGDLAPLHEFYAAATALAQPRASGWPAIVERGPVASAAESTAMVADLLAGRAPQLARSAVTEVAGSAGERGFGMCGRLTTYNVGGTA
jgi:mannose-6-phosphate isomerase-like protein (cupin superfamily)